jgi:cytochrome b6
MKRGVTRLQAWFDERLDLSSLVELARHKVVPIHRESIWYYFGGITLFLFLMQVGTGILLMLYYRPGPDTAFESIQFILSEVEFGWLVRAIHSWSANLMLVSAFLHMFSVFFTRGYRKPRELTWVTGVVLLLIAFAFGFSGYLLPWNELAFFATKVGTDIIGAVPGVGRPLLTLLRGGEDVTAATLFRFYAIHVAVLPGVLVAILLFHLLLVQRQGVSTPEGWEQLPATRRRQRRFFPNFLLRELLVWVIVLNLLALLAVVAPFGAGPLEWPLGQKADAFAPAPAGIRPEWYFMFMFQTLRLLPAKMGWLEGEVAGVLFFAGAGLLWLAVPFLDRSPGSARVARWLGALALAYLLTMTVWGYSV